MARAGPLLVGALIFVFVGIASGQTVLNISVDSLDDDEPTAGCTLREAITMANNGMSESVGCVAIAAGSGEPRSFRIELPAFTYTLVGDGGENDNLSGDLDVLGNLNIAGAGQNLTIIRGPSDDAVFHVIAASARLRLEDLAVEGGGSGGIVSAGFLELDSIRVSDNRGTGVLSHGDLQVTQTIIDNNFAWENGGGIYSDGRLTVSDTSIRQNGARGRGAGAYIAGPAILIDTVIAANSASSDGGGLYATGPDDQLILGSAIVDNSSERTGGGVYVESALDLANTTIAGNVAEFEGGALVVAPGPEGSVNLSHVTVTDNVAQEVGGIVGAPVGAGLILRLANTIVAGNRSVGYQATADDCLRAFSDGFNLVGSNAGCIDTMPPGNPNRNGDFVGTSRIPFDPRLVRRGGLFTYFEPELSSAAVDRIPAADCVYRLSPVPGHERPANDGDPVLVDQLRRQRDAQCDIGAVEIDLLFVAGFESP